MSRQDPFTGIWKFNPERSRLSSPPPRSWVQRIDATDHEMRIREEIITSAGSQTVVTIQAKCDGAEYLVSGSPVADVIAYTRVDAYCISGTAKKNNSISLKETLVVAPEDCVLTMTYSIYAGDREVANGIAVFENAQN